MVKNTIKGSVKPNQKLRDEIKASPVYNYEVAQELGITDNYFGLMLRHPLKPEQLTKIKAAMKSAIAKKEAAAKSEGAKVNA